ncbi:MAG: hypothetical protein JRD01_02935 [Deltaproteobacteria bacterium]|nr:hypothetical protein [Deltaproteobacteria bacterium]
MEPFAIDLDEEDIKRERRKARELRGSQWWKRRRAAACKECNTAKKQRLPMEWDQYLKDVGSNLS